MLSRTCTSAAGAAHQPKGYHKRCFTRGTSVIMAAQPDPPRPDEPRYPAGKVAEDLKNTFVNEPVNKILEKQQQIYDERVASNVAQSDVTWPSPFITKMWKFFFKANTGNTDRFGVALPIQSFPGCEDLSDEQRQALRDKAARDGMNITDHERQLRIKLGVVSLVVVLGVAASMVQNKADFWSRLAIMPFFFLAAAETVSGITGL